jgi:hypothetical protein
MSRLGFEVSVQFINGKMNSSSNLPVITTKICEGWNLLLLGIWSQSPCSQLEKHKPKGPFVVCLHCCVHMLQGCSPHLGKFLVISHYFLGLLFVQNILSQYDGNDET